MTSEHLGLSEPPSIKLIFPSNNMSTVNGTPKEQENVGIQRNQVVMGRLDCEWLVIGRMVRSTNIHGSKAWYPGFHRNTMILVVRLDVHAINISRHRNVQLFCCSELRCINLDKPNWLYPQRTQGPCTSHTPATSSISVVALPTAVCCVRSQSIAAALLVYAMTQ